MKMDDVGLLGVNTAGIAISVEERSDRISACTPDRYFDERIEICCQRVSPGALRSVSDYVAERRNSGC